MVFDDGGLRGSAASQEDLRTALLRGGLIGDMVVADDGSASHGDHMVVEISDTAHQISQDSWFQVGFVLTTGINSAYVLGYSGTIMVPLGWYGGVIGLLLATAISLYANMLVAKLHEYGGKRHIRYRDLAGFIYGEQAYNITWALQYVNLFMINVGYIILSGSALKALYVLFQENSGLKLPHFIAIAGVACILFAISVPHLSALGAWLAFSTLFSLVYIIIAFVLALKDGMPSHFPLMIDSVVCTLSLILTVVFDMIKTQFTFACFIVILSFLFLSMLRFQRKFFVGSIKWIAFFSISFHGAFEMFAQTYNCNKSTNICSLKDFLSCLIPLEILWIS